MQPVDPVLLNILQQRLDVITEEMGLNMMRTARSPIFSEAHDFSCYITDAQGRLIAQRDGLPIHTGSGGFAVRAVLKEFAGDIHEGDLFILNDPYLASGNHLPDWTVINPIFLTGTLTAFSCNRAHQIDIGGNAPGTYNSLAREIFAEGIRIPPIKLWRRGKEDRDILKLLAHNTRSPEVIEADLRAMIGSTIIGAGRLKELNAEMPEAISYFPSLLDYAERLMRSEIEKIPDGVYESEEFMNNDCFSDTPVRIKLALTIRGSDIVADFRGSSPQIRAFKNSPYANTCAATFIAISTIVDPYIPHNEGTYRMVEVRAEEGSIVNCTFPAPVTFCTVYPAHEIIQAVWKALSQAAPERVSAGWGKPSYPAMMPLPGKDFYVMYHWGGSSGGGAVRGRDGFDQLGQMVTLGGLILPNAELYEQAYPCRYLKQEFRQDAGGAGEYRGGSGVEYVVDVTEPAVYSLRGEGLRTKMAFGVAGGEDGREGSLWVEIAGRRRDLPQYDMAELPPCRMTILSPAGGGWGDPLRRDPERVRADVKDGLVSMAEAKRAYGVVIDGETLEVDAAETERERKARRKGSV